MKTRFIAALVTFSAILADSAMAQGVPPALLGNWCDADLAFRLSGDGAWELSNGGTLGRCGYNIFSKTQSGWTSSGVCGSAQMTGARATWTLSQNGQALTKVVVPDRGQRVTYRLRRC